MCLLQFYQVSRKRTSMQTNNGYISTFVLALLIEWDKLGSKVARHILMQARFVIQLRRVYNDASLIDSRVY